MLSGVIMAHRRREHFVSELQGEIGLDAVWDERNNRWDTGRRALLAHDPKATHHLVVQDDAILCRDFIAGCEAVADAAGERPIGLYIGSLRPNRHAVGPALRNARKIGAPWLEMEGPWWGVAIILPTPHIGPLVEWCDANPVENYDMRITKFYKHIGLECWYTVPSLVDHRPVTENPSLIPGRNGNRYARWFIGDASPLDVDWSKPPSRLHATFRHPHSGKVAKVIIGHSNYLRMSKNKAWERVA